jgi:hypothetical protein
MGPHRTATGPSGRRRQDFGERRLASHGLNVVASHTNLTEFVPSTALTPRNTHADFALADALCLLVLH